MLLIWLLYPIGVCMHACVCTCLHVCLRVCVCLCMHACVCVCVSVCGFLELSDLSEAGVKGSVSCLMSVLGTKYLPSGRAVHVLNHWVISVNTEPQFLRFKNIFISKFSILCHWLIQLSLSQGITALIRAVLLETGFYSNINKVFHLWSPVCLVRDCLRAVQRGVVCLIWMGSFTHLWR